MVLRRPRRLQRRLGGGSGALGDSARVQKRRLQWFDRYLKGNKTRTGPPFEWIDQNGEWHGSPAAIR